MIYKDYYKILELKTSRVSIDEIKSAYRAAAKKYHPDLNVGDTLAEERIKDINEAYRILSVPASKRKYDRIWNSRNNDKVYNNEKFKLLGYNLYTDLLITPWEAALGTRTNLQTLDGETTIYIPQGMQSGEKIKIPNKGYKDGNGGRGDLIAEVKIMIPKKLTQEEEKLFNKLKDVSKFNPRNS